MKKSAALLMLIVLAVFWAAPAGAVTMPGRNFNLKEDNLHQVDGPQPDGQPAYRLYRSGAPSREVFASWCKVYNIDRVIVMSGDAASHELKYQAEGVCPNIQVIYDQNQRWDLPVERSFLDWFDAEAASAKQDRAGLLFRCKTGSHRTGRLAAYYRMKYQDMSVNEAIDEMNDTGTLMPFFGLWMTPQVRAIDDYVHDRPCSRFNLMCVAG